MDNTLKFPETPEVPEHLKHLPASCGRCGNDHRLAMHVDSTEDTEREYGELVCQIMKLDVLETDPAKKAKDTEYGNYWKGLYEAELRHRYANPDKVYPGRPEIPVELQTLLDKLGPAIAGILSIDPKNGSIKKLK